MTVLFLVLNVNIVKMLHIKSNHYLATANISMLPCCIPGLLTQYPHGYTAGMPVLQSPAGGGTWREMEKPSFLLLFYRRRRWLPAGTLWARVPAVPWTVCGSWALCPVRPAWGTWDKSTWPWGKFLGEGRGWRVRELHSRESSGSESLFEAHNAGAQAPHLEILRCGQGSRASLFKSHRYTDSLVLYQGECDLCHW